MSARRGGSRSEGFTLVEVVIAASIMFFALNALFGLAAATSQMAGTSRGRSILTNVVTGRFDLYRTYSFSDLELRSNGGLIPESEATTAAGWTIHLASTVTPSSAYPDTKEVTIVGTASHPGLPAVAYSASVVLRGLRASSSSGETTSAVSFVTPDDRSIVSGTVVIRASANSSMNKIAAFEFKVNTGSQDVYLIDAPGNLSTYLSMTLPVPATGSYTQPLGFPWDSPRLDGSGNHLFPDGFRTVSIWMKDDHGHAQGPIQRTFLLDNYGPQTPPANMRITPSPGMSGPTPVLTVSGSWDAALDGTDPAPKYEAILFHDSHSNTAGSLAAMDHSVTYAASPTPASADSGFSRWVLQTQGFSARSLPGVAGVAVGYTPPIITGTGTQSAVAGYSVTYNALLVVPPPQYPIGSVTSIRVQRTVAGGATSYITVSGAAARAAWAANLAYSISDALTQNGISKNSTAADVTYRVLTQLKPSGYSTDETPLLTSSAIVLHSATAAKNVGSSAPLTASASW
jgi:hypothetical protein